ncbi:hypothetical protein NDU88_001761 [Pleurodeles waltl]|uniref:Uncharacterized protein n=1 Tax=Pleurodeles waltl TaxID=8319 RepID=A0AAV7T0C9_PLEWA|nr:hypothetical protein NDU88_001761 [Pleurodeles waltl]
MCKLPSFWDEVCCGVKYGDKAAREPQPGIARDLRFRCREYGSVVSGVPVRRCWKERLEDSTAAVLVYKTCRGTIKPLIHGLELTVKSLKIGEREVLIGVCVEEGD